MNRISLSFVLILIFTSCGLMKIDQQKSQAVVESLLNDLKNENYSSLDKYYSSSFNSSEPIDQKVEKFKQLKNTLGGIKSYQLISSKQTEDSDKGTNQLELKYKVVCERVTVEETYLIINDEGDLKIIFQDIQNIK